MAEPRCIGIDFGTDSVRVVLVRADTGDQEGRAVAAYPRWSEGRYSDAAANRFRQHPLDYTESLERACRELTSALSAAQREAIIGIGIDTTGSTVCAVDEAGTPLSLDARFAENPNAMFVLWKDHTAVREADEINTLAHTWGGIDYTCYSRRRLFLGMVLGQGAARAARRRRGGGRGLVVDRALRLDPRPADRHHAPGELRRGRAAAGHKAMWHASWGGLPSADFLGRLDPRLATLRGGCTTTRPPPTRAPARCPASGRGGSGCRPASRSRRRLRRPPGRRRRRHPSRRPGQDPGHLHLRHDRRPTPAPSATALIAGICGQVDGSIIPGLVGLEAGQSAYGDVYAWFRDLLSWPLRSLAAGQRSGSRWKRVCSTTSRTPRPPLPPDPAGMLSLDWFNGRRTPNADAGAAGGDHRPQSRRRRPGPVPLPGRGHRLRQPRHQRAPGRRRHPGRRDHRPRRHLAALRLRRAGGRRRARHADQGVGHRGGPRSRRHDVRRHRRRPLRHRAGGAGRHGARLQDHLRTGPGACRAVHRRLPALPSARRNGGIRRLAPRLTVGHAGHAVESPLTQTS